MFRLILFFAALLCLSMSAFTQNTGKRPMRIVDFLNIAGLSDPQLSPDGRRIAYVLANSDWKANKQVGHIWWTLTDGTGATQLTWGENAESTPRWSPDGTALAFLATRGANAKKQVFLLPVSGGEARPLTQHTTDVSDYAWSGDGQTIYFIAEDEKSEQLKKKQEKKDDVYGYSEDFQHTHLWRIDLTTRKEKRLSSGSYSVRSFSVALDGQHLLFSRAPDPSFGEAYLSELWLMKADSSAVWQLTNNQYSESNARLSPDGRQVLFLAGVNQQFEPYYNDKLFLLPAAQSQSFQTPQIILPDITYEWTAAEWAADGQSVYLLANMGLEVQLWQYHFKTKRLTQLTQGQHAIEQWQYTHRQNRHIFTLNTAENPGDVAVLQAGSPVQVTHHFDYLRDTFLLPKQERVSWKGKDGIVVEGLLHYPINYQAGQRYPLVVQTHGGPAAADHYGFSRRVTHYHPVLAAQGYAVLQPNYRGSTGYGDPFLRDMVGGYFTNCHLDVMAGVDALIDRGVVDPDKLVKMGWSAGGHLTNKMITYTDRFKAASSGAGAVNWISMYAQSDTRTYRTPWFGGTPWQENAPINAYWDHSPLKDIAKAKTPTLIFVGEKDVRVPSPQSVELYQALKSLGVPTHLYIAPREPHGWGELRHRLFKVNTELSWFAKYALGASFEEEKAPE